LEDCKAKGANTVNDGLEILARLIARKAVHDFRNQVKWHKQPELIREKPSKDNNAEMKETVVYEQCQN